MDTSRKGVPSGWSAEVGAGRIVAAAVHSGHEVRPEVADLLALSDSRRLTEEDPFTDRLTRVAPNRVIVHRSRFEVDLNRPRSEAVYRRPDAAWDLRVWKDNPPEEIVQRSLELHDEFYSFLHGLLTDITQREGGFVLLDLHSYNHRREGPDRPPADPAGNPDVNVGTGSLDRTRWGPLVDSFMEELRRAGDVDVRENVRFKGRHLAAWTHSTWPGRACCLALEFKKTFMDEHTGELYEDRLDALVEALRYTVPVLEEELQKALGPRSAARGW